MRQAVAGRVLAAVCGAVTVTGAGFGWMLWEDSRSVPMTDRVCEPGVLGEQGVSGVDGWCVQRRRAEAGLFRDEVDQLYFVRVQDDQAIPRATYADYPFHDDGLRVTFNAGSITVAGEDGATVTFSEKFYALAL